jgi:hypothetical protein
MTSEAQAILVITDGMMVSEWIGKNLEGIGHGWVWGIFLGGPMEDKKRSIIYEGLTPDRGLNPEYSEYE